MIALLRTYLRPYRGSLAMVIILLLIHAVGTLYLPDLNADIINNGIVAGNNDYIISTGALMLGVTLLLGIASILAVYWGAKASMGFGRDVRTAIFRKVESFAQVEVNQFGPASLITRNTNDVQQVQTVCAPGGFPNAVAADVAPGMTNRAFRVHRPPGTPPRRPSSSRAKRGAA